MVTPETRTWLRDLETKVAESTHSHDLEERCRRSLEALTDKVEEIRASKPQSPVSDAGFEIPNYRVWRRIPPPIPERRFQLGRGDYAVFGVTVAVTTIVGILAMTYVLMRLGLH